MTHTALHKRKMTRKQFENLFAGEWVQKPGFRQNGQFRTGTGKNPVTGEEWKLIKGKGFAIRGKSWFEIARSLKLVQP